MRTKHTAKKLAKQLTAAGVPAVELHGNLSQGARERNLAAFTDGSTRVLVATDIAARGIHVDDIALVVHVDPPAEHKAYLHRSGRTARAGAGGAVVTLALPDQAGDVRALAKQAGITPTTRNVPPRRPGDHRADRPRRRHYVEPALPGAGGGAARARSPATTSSSPPPPAAARAWSPPGPTCSPSMTAGGRSTPRRSRRWSARSSSRCATSSAPTTSAWLTGDASVNPRRADHLLHRRGARQPGAARQGGPDVGLVVMDEFHFYADPERGWAWQVPLLEMPQHAVPADVGHPRRHDVLRERPHPPTGREVGVVAHAERPVPLRFVWSLDPLHETLEELLADPTRRRSTSCTSRRRPPSSGRRR